MLENQTQTSANKRGIAGVIKFFGALIIIGGIVYSEILFLGIVSVLFPTGPMGAGAMLGALTTGVSILVLCLGKSNWFRPGYQLIIAWIFTLTEVAVLIMNDLLAYQMHTGGQLDTYTAMWKTFCVAAPVISVVGWILLFYFDPERAITHKRMEMEDNQAGKQIDFESKMHNKTLALRTRAAEMALTKFEEKIESQLEYHLDTAAAKYAARVATELTGEHVSHADLLGPVSSAKQLSSPKVVESLVTPALAASKDQVLDPGQVKSEVDAEKQKPKSIGSMLGGIHAGIHNAIDKALDKPQRLPVEQPQEEVEEIKQPKLPSDPSKWSHKHWMIAHDTLPWSEYKDLFDRYRGDEPEKEYEVIDKPITEDRPGHDPRTRRLGGNEEFEDQEDLDENPS